MSTITRCLSRIPLLGLPLAASGSELDARFELALNRVLSGGPPHYTADFVLADAKPEHVRRFTEFSGDVSGRYVDALSAAALGTGRAQPALDAVVAALPALQKADGHFGGPFGADPAGVTTTDMAILWGNGRLLCGLMESCRLRPDPATLGAARKLGDFLAGIAPTYNTAKVRDDFSGKQHAVGYICWTQVLEGLVALHEATHDARYLAVSRDIAKFVMRHPGQHSHGFLTTLRGLVDLARVTGDHAYLEQAEREWQGLKDSGNWRPQGSVPEALKPNDTRSEGCTEADALRLCLALWGATRQGDYLDDAEHVLFNEFFSNEFSTGDFGHRTYSADGLSPAMARAWWCCTLHGLRAFPDVAAAVFHAEGAALAYDLPLSGRAEADGFAVEAQSALERDGTVRLVVKHAPATPRALAVRVPPWAASVELAGAAQAAGQGPAPMRLERAWKEGDALTVTYRMRTRVIAHPDRKDRVAFAHGPWFLGVDDDASPTFFDEPSSDNKLVDAVSAGSEVRLTPAPAAAPGARFAVPAARFRLAYLPGGYPVQPQTALLRPIAEQTGARDATEWVFWFRPAAGKP